MKGRFASVGIALTSLALVACGGGGPTATQPTVSPTPTSLPSNEEIAAAMLTPEEIGEGFAGDPPTKESPKGVAVATKPLCGIEEPKGRKSMTAYSRTATDTPDQVYEIIRIYEAGDAEIVMERTRQRGEARCSRREKVGEFSYRTQVDGPIELPTLGEEVAGFSQTYSKGYDGHRWTMVARTGRVTVYMEYTTTEPIDPDVAEEIFTKAVEKAGRIV